MRHVQPIDENPFDKRAIKTLEQQHNSQSIKSVSTEQQAPNFDRDLIRGPSSAPTQSKHGWVYQTERSYSIWTRNNRDRQSLFKVESSGFRCSGILTDMMYRKREHLLNQLKQFEKDENRGPPPFITHSIIAIMLVWGLLIYVPQCSVLPSNFSEIQSKHSVGVFVLGRHCIDENPV